MKWAKGDQGTVLLWTLGVLIVCASVLVSLLSFGSYVMTQRTLEALTDDASLASVSALSLDDFISTGDVSRISLNHVKVLSRVKQIIADSHRPITLEKVLVDVAQVSVQLGMDWTDISGHITRHISAISTANFTPEIDEDANL